MAANKIVRFGPTALSASLTTNLFNPPVLSGGVGVPTDSTTTYFLIKRIRIVNKTGSPATFSLWLGASGANAAGTEVIGNAKSVAGNDAFDWTSSPGLRLDTTDFLVGGASGANALTLEGEGEIGIA
jgi:hypothetical protein